MSILTGVVTAAVIGGISFLMSRTKPKQTDDGQQLIRMPKVLCYIGIVSCLFLCALGGGIIVFGSEEGIGTKLIAGVLFVACALLIPLSVNALGSSYDVVWNEEGITGPSKLYTFKVRQSRITINWNDISKLGETALRSIYVESKDGRRIFWSMYYTGQTVLEQRIAAEIEAKRFE